jgi:hypothetical protein
VPREGWCRLSAGEAAEGPRLHDRACGRHGGGDADLAHARAERGADLRVEGPGRGGARSSACSTMPGAN